MLGWLYNMIFGFSRKFIPTIPSDDDSRDHEHIDKSVKILEANWNPRVGLIESQGNKPRCVGQATEVGARVHTNIMRKIDCYLDNSGFRMADYDAQRFYEECKKIDGHSDEPGTSPRAAMKVLKKIGLVENLPYKNNIYQCNEYWRCKSIEEALNDLYTTGPVLIVIKWMHSFFTGNGVLIPKSMDIFEGYHAISLTKRTKEDNAEKITRGVNSYGRSWGQCGHFVLPDSQWKNLVREAWCFK